MYNLEQGAGVLLYDIENRSVYLNTWTQSAVIPLVHTDPRYCNSHFL